MASITLSPTSGIFGTSITVTGTAFALTTVVTLTWEGTTLATTPTVITTDGSGGFTATITPINYVYDDNTVSATDVTNTATATFSLTREPQYCDCEDIADWLRINLTANTDPNRTMVDEFIIMNEDEMDRKMGHTFQPERQVREIFDVTRLWDWGRGLPIFPRHHNLRDFDVTKGDKVEVWTGSGYQDQSANRVFVEEIKGTFYLKGYLFTILTKARFRITYRYGGNQEFQNIPKDIKKCAILMTALDILGTDFKMSQVAYGGEGNVDKQKIMDKWQTKVDSIISDHSEIITIW